jgi:hypothetical protein
MRTLALLVTVVMALALSGCEALCGAGCAPREHHSSSSLVDFLYPWLIDLPHDARDSSAAAFSTAADQMIGHLGSALTDFQAQVRVGHANVQVVHKDGSKGGAGAFSWGWLAVLVPLLVWRIRRAMRAAAQEAQDRQAAAEAAANAAATGPGAHPAAHRPAVRSGMRRPRTVRSARATPMRVPRLSARN